MSAKLGSEDWAPQAPPADFAATVSRAMPLRKMAEEWRPQQPSSAFGFLTAAFVAHVAKPQTQQGRIGIRTIRAIFGDVGGAEGVGTSDPLKQAQRGLLVHLFFRFVEREAASVLAEADGIESDEKAAIDLAKDAVRRATKTLSLRADDASRQEIDQVVGSGESRRVRSFHVRVCEKMKRPGEIASHLTDVESERWRIVREAFLFFLDQDRKAQGAPASNVG